MQNLRHSQHRRVAATDEAVKQSDNRARFGCCLCPRLRRREGAKAAATKAEAERRSISRDSFLRIGFRDSGVGPTRRPLLLGWPVAVGRPALVSVSRWIEGVVQNAVR